jgi:hypothetical protein
MRTRIGKLADVFYVIGCVLLLVLLAHIFWQGHL